MSQEFSHKNLLLTSPTRAFGCIQRYVQGPGEINNVFALGRKYGDNFFFIIDTGVFEMIRDMIERIDDKCGCTYTFKSFFGECCKENVAELADAVKKAAAMLCSA